MNQKIVLKNNYHKRLSFESVLNMPFAMEGYEVRSVDLDIGVKLLQNVWVSEVGKEINPECLPYMEKRMIADIPPMIVEPEKPIEIPKEIPIEIPITKEPEKLVEKVAKEVVNK